MRTLKSWLLPTVAAASTAGYLLFGGPPPPNNPSLTTITESNGGVRFVISNLPALSSLSDDPHYKVFINTGDGFFISKTVPQLSTGVSTCTIPDPNTSPYYYGKPGQYSTYTDLTYAYDDDDLPPLRVSNPNPVVINAGSTTDNSTMFSGWAKIESNRKVVPGDPITYIVTYQNRLRCTEDVHGNITLMYDTSKLEHLWAERFFGEDDSTHNISGNTGTMRWTYLGLAPGEQRNIFYVFRAKNASLGDTLNPTPTLIFTHGNDTISTGDCANAITTVVHEGSNTVANSHDPNGKTANLESICDSDEEITYTVRFQNEGNYPAKKVVIEDELNSLFGQNVPRFVASSHDTTSFHYNKQKRKLTVTFSESNQSKFSLRGLAEPDYGKMFTEEATMGWVTFKVALPDFNPNLYCKILANKAFITFDCNPPIPTNKALTPFKCNWRNTSCMDCQTVFDTTIVLNANTDVGKPISKDVFPEKWLAQKMGSLELNNYKWYPQEELGNPNLSLPSFSNPLYKDYTLVVTSPRTCKSAIIHFTVNFNKCDNLQIVVDPIGLQVPACGGQKSGYIHAWATGGTGLHTWQDCTKREAADTLRMDGYAPGKYYLAITDAKGCTAERWVEIKYVSTPLHVDDDPNDCKANLKITGGTPPYQTSWEYVHNGQTKSSTATNLDLTGVTAAQVTVTDNNGCSVTFMPKKSICASNPNGGGGGWVWALFGFLAAAFGAWAFYFRKKQ